MSFLAWVQGQVESGVLSVRPERTERKKKDCIWHQMASDIARDIARAMKPSGFTGNNYFPVVVENQAFFNLLRNIAPETAILSSPVSIHTRKTYQKVGAGRCSAIRHA